MSYNQPGPYGGQPPQGQPGPYGQQPGPYGGQPPQGPPQGQPGYGYPQQAPQGVPPQQPPQGYGYPQGQQPGPYGQQPPTPPYGGQAPYGGQMPPAAPKKKTGLIVTGAVVALAVIAGGVYFLTSGGASNSDVADSTKGFKLTPAKSVDDYKQDTTSKQPPAGPATGEEKTKAEAMGIKNPHNAGAQYMSGTEANPLLAKLLILKGVWGEVEDPAKVIDSSFTSAQQEAEKDGDAKGSLVGSPKNVTPEGFKGALMKCQDMKMKNEGGDGSAKNGPSEFVMPVCIWADYSTVGIVIGLDIGGAVTNKPMPQSEVADLAAKLYNTSRTKV